MKIAILIATFNRKEKTLACLKKVFNQENLEGFKYEIFLTDDASTDGTEKEARALYPNVNIYKGTGALFWAGGMRSSWNEAIKGDFDYFLLLNDDTFLFKDSIAKLIQSNLEFHKLKAVESISIGTTKDIETNMISYGGRKFYSKYTPKSYLVNPNNVNQACDVAEANIMLVPKKIVQKIGILSEKYTHSIADLDYTLRAIKAGFKVVVAPGFFGTCTNDHGKSWKSGATRLSDRVKYLYDIKGLSYKEYLYFIAVHFPFHLPSAFLKLWLKTLFPFVYDRYKEK